MRFLPGAQRWSATVSGRNLAIWTKYKGRGDPEVQFDPNSTFTLLDYASTPMTRRVAASLRVGYAYEPSPVPEQSEATNFLDADRQLASLGAGFRFDGPRPWLGGGLALDLVYVAGFLDRRRYSKSEADEPSYGFGGRFWSAGAELGCEF